MQVFGVHGASPQRPGPPPPQTAGITHVPQSSIPPHLSGMGPQLTFSAWHVVGVHPQRLGMPLAPQVVPGQPPQSMV
jgi:hypothetical protein